MNTIGSISKRSFREETISVNTDCTPLVAHIVLGTMKRMLFCPACFSEWVEGETQIHQKTCRTIK